MLGAITVRNVSKTFSTEGTVALEALREVSVEILPGQFVAFVGPSGCGKSTLLKLIGGLLEPSSGHISVGASQVTGPSRGIGVMFQTPVLFPWRTVLENVLLPIEVFGLERRAATEKARDILRLVGLEGREGAYPRELSGGMQQRAALSRVLVIDPSIILMDEPFGALDEFTRERMNLELLRIWQERGQTIVFVTHSISEAVFLADRVVVMDTAPGRVLAVVDVPLPRPRSIDLMKSPEFAGKAFEVREYLGVAR
ncbi:MAG: ABC transporter ATP-binding protein [Betaproteobacteria bacterium]|nr:MAG: ABC transporter ATP-binding protein [Betaproteobacteria bacterium]